METTVLPVVISAIDAGICATVMIRLLVFMWRHPSLVWQANIEWMLVAVLFLFVAGRVVFLVGNNAPVMFWSYVPDMANVVVAMIWIKARANGLV